MRGLLIRQPYIGMILDGSKTWEMRSKRCHFREQIALIQAGTKNVLGVAEVIDCLGPLTDEQRCSSAHLHGLEPDRWLDPNIAKYRFAWVLGKMQRLSIPVPYVPKSGPVTWILLGDSVAQAISAQLAAPQ